MGIWDNLPCQAGWLPTNHILFHFANVCLFLSYCAPPGLHGLLYLRVVLFFACLFFALWGWLVLCAMDTFMWNAIFTIMNAVQTYLAYQMLPRKISFLPVIETLYEKLFSPLKVTKEEFQPIYNAATEVIYFGRGDLFDVAYMADAVCLVIRGRIGVVSDKKLVKEYYQYEFVNPAAYFRPTAVSESLQHQEATLVALDANTIVLIWRREDLQSVLNRDAHARVVFDCLVSRQMAQDSAMPEKVPLPISFSYPMIEAIDGNVSDAASSNNDSQQV